MSNIDLNRMSKALHNYRSNIYILFKQLVYSESMKGSIAIYEVNNVYST